MPRRSPFGAGFAPRRPMMPGGKEPITDDKGRPYDSVGEMEYHGQLKTRELAGEVRNIERQVRLPMVVNGRKIRSGWFTLDFRYQEWADGAWRWRHDEYKGPWDDRDGETRAQVAAACNDIEIRIVKPQQRRKRR